MKWQIEEGGYGNHLNAQGGEYTSDPMHNRDLIAYRVQEPARVQVVLTGDHAKGSLTAEWEIVDGTEA